MKLNMQIAIQSKKTQQKSAVIDINPSVSILTAKVVSTAKASIAVSAAD